MVAAQLSCAGLSGEEAALLGMSADHAGEVVDVLMQLHQLRLLWVPVGRRQPAANRVRQGLLGGLVGQVGEVFDGVLIPADLTGLQNPRSRPDVVAELRPVSLGQDDRPLGCCQRRFQVGGRGIAGPPPLHGGGVAQNCIPVADLDRRCGAPLALGDDSAQSTVSGRVDLVDEPVMAEAGPIHVFWLDPPAGLALDAVLVVDLDRCVQSSIQVDLIDRRGAYAPQARKARVFQRSRTIGREEHLDVRDILAVVTDLAQLGVERLGRRQDGWGQVRQRAPTQ